MSSKGVIPVSRCRDQRVRVLMLALNRVSAQTSLWVWIHEEAIRNWIRHGRPLASDWADAGVDAGPRPKQVRRPNRRVADSGELKGPGWPSFLDQIEPAYHGWTEAIGAAISSARAAAPVIDDAELHVTRRMSTRLEYRLRRLLSFFPPGRLGDDGLGIARVQQQPAPVGLLNKLNDQLTDDGLMLESLPRSLVSGGAESGWTFERLCAVGGISRGTLRSIMIDAKVARPKSGQRDFRLSDQALAKLIRTAKRTRQKLKWLRAGERWEVALGEIDA